MSRYDLTDFEWRVIEPLLPTKPRGVPRVDDRRVLNGIFWVLRSGAPWRDLPEPYGPRTTCYNRFVRWRKAGVWDRLMDAISAALRGAVAGVGGKIGDEPILARMGGEEFVCLLPRTTRGDANRAAEAIRARVEDDRTEGRPPVAVSVGLAVGEAGEARSLEDLLRAADRALYRAKREGRNRVKEERLPGGDGPKAAAAPYA